MKSLFKSSKTAKELNESGPLHFVQWKAPQPCLVKLLLMLLQAVAVGKTVGDGACLIAVRNRL